MHLQAFKYTIVIIRKCKGVESTIVKIRKIKGEKLSYRCKRVSPNSGVGEQQADPKLPPNYAELLLLDYA